MILTRLLRYRPGDSFYHRHHPLLKMVELLAGCVLANVASWQWNMALIGILLPCLWAMIGWRWWWRLLVSQLLLWAFLTAFSFASFQRQMPLADAWQEALDLSLPINSMLMQALIFIRHTDPLVLIGHLSALGRWPWLRRGLLMAAMVLLFFPLIFAQLLRRQTMFVLRGGRWWPWWKSLPSLLAPFLLDIERRSQRLGEALVLRGDWQNLFFSERTGWRRRDWVFFAAGLTLAVLGAVWL